MIFTWRGKRWCILYYSCITYFVLFIYSVFQQLDLDFLTNPNVFPCSPSQVNDLVFCAGQIALVPCTMQLVKAGTYTQACLSFSHVKKVLEAVINSLTLAHVIQAHCYTTRHRDIKMIRAVWKSMLRAREEEQVSHCGITFMFIKYMPAVNCNITVSDRLL